MSQSNPESENHKSKELCKKEDPQEGQEKTMQEQQLNYYNEYCRLYLANAVLSTQLKQLNLQKNQLLGKLTKLEKKADEFSDGNSANTDEKRKRIRRSASQIARHYKCQAENCSKSYGSEGSLNQHIKIKHPELFKTLGYLVSSNPTVKQSNEQNNQSV